MMSDRPAPGRRIPSFAAMIALVREDFATHRRRIAEPGLHAVALYRFGAWVDGISARPLRWPLRALHYGLNALVEIVYGICLSHRARIGRRVRLVHAGAGLVIGGDCVIGDDCLLRQNVTLGNHSRKRPGAPTLGDRVEVGANAVLVGPIMVGEDVIIGPNTVVMDDVPPNSTVLPPAPAVTPRRRPVRLSDAARGLSAGPGRGPRRAQRPG
jgi:serine O-acetyltransferase